METVQTSIETGEPAKPGWPSHMILRNCDDRATMVKGYQAPKLYKKSDSILMKPNKGQIKITYTELHPIFDPVSYHV